MEKGLKIAYLVSEYPAVSHTFIFREIHELRKLGFQVLTASVKRPSNPGKMTEQEKRDAESTFYILSPPLKGVALALAVLFSMPLRFARMAAYAMGTVRKRTGGILKPLAYLVEACGLLWWASRNKVGHVHVHFANPAATVALIASRTGLLEFSMSVHGPDVFYNVERNMLDLKVRHAKFVRCISHFCRSQLMMFAPPGIWDKFRIVRCGVDPEVFKPNGHVAGGIPEILSIGRLVPAKGWHVLIKAFAALKETGLDFRATMVGGGSVAEELKEEVSRLGLGDRVELVGAVSPDKVHFFYDRADIFVLPSFAEGVPVVLMEAMAKEIPVVSTRITGIPELIEDGRSGFLATPSDHAELAGKIESLVRDGKTREMLGKEARRKVMEKYNLAENCRDMADLFRAFVKGDE